MECSLQRQMSSCSILTSMGNVSKDILRKYDAGALKVFIWNLRTLFSLLN